MIIKLIIYVAFILVCRFTAIMYEWTFLDIIWRSLIVIGGVGIVSIITVWFRVSLSLDVSSDRIVKGKTIPVCLEVNNRSLLPVLIIKVIIESNNDTYGMTSIENASIPVAGWGVHRYTFNVVAGSCGNLNLKIKKIKVKDWTGLFSISKKIGEVSVIPVLPAYSGERFEEPKRNNAVFIDSEIYSKDKPGDDPSEVFDIRQMREGDSVHSVNWKMSARKDTFMVNDYSLPEGNGTVVLLDNCFPLGMPIISEQVDGLFEKVLSISVSLQEYGVIHDIVWYDFASKMCVVRKVMPDENVAGIFSEIYKSQFYACSSHIIDFYNTEYDTEVLSHMYYVTMSNDMAMVTNIGEGRANTIKNIYVVNNTFTSEQVALSEALGINIEGC